MTFSLLLSLLTVGLILMDAISRFSSTHLRPPCIHFPRICGALHRFVRIITCYNSIIAAAIGDLEV